MPHTLLACSLLAGLAIAQAPAGPWLQDFDAAKTKAKAEQKFLLVNFSASDWNGWSIRLQGDASALRVQSPEAEVLLLAVATQESALRHRTQVGGPEILGAAQAEVWIAGQFGRFFVQPLIANCRHPGAGIENQFGIDAFFPE